MKEYEQYHKKGGFYEIPVEIFNELFADIEDSNDSITWWQNRANALSKTNEEHRKINGELREENKVLKKEIEMCDKKIDKLRLARDKAIEYIENDLQSFLYSIEYKTLLEILKGDSNE